MHKGIRILVLVFSLVRPFGVEAATHRSCAALVTAAALSVCSLMTGCASNAERMSRVTVEDRQNLIEDLQIYEIDGNADILTLHLKQIHSIPEITRGKTLAGMKEKSAYIDLILNSQLNILNQILRHPEIPVFAEGMTIYESDGVQADFSNRAIDERIQALNYGDQDADFQENQKHRELIQRIFSGPIPHSVAELTEEQKTTLIIYDAPWVAYFLGRIPRVYPAESIDTREAMREYDRLHPNEGDSEARLRYRFKQRETDVFKNIYRFAAQTGYKGPVFAIYGANHRFFEYQILPKIRVESVEPTSEAVDAHLRPH